MLSDGADTASDRGLTETRETLRRLDAFVYAIAIDAAGEQRVSTRVNPAALQEITAPSGGYTEVVRGYEQIGPATQRIADITARFEKKSIVSIPSLRKYS